MIRQVQSRRRAPLPVVVLLQLLSAHVSAASIVVGW